MTSEYFQTHSIPIITNRICMYERVYFYGLNNLPNLLFFLYLEKMFNGAFTIRNISMELYSNNINIICNCSCVLPGNQLKYSCYSRSMQFRIRIIFFPSITVILSILFYQVFCNNILYLLYLHLNACPLCEYKQSHYHFRDGQPKYLQYNTFYVDTGSIVDI